MEIRKVQITGGATFMVTLPKDWARETQLRSGSPVGIIRQPPDLLVIQPQREHSARRGQLVVEGKTGNALVRELIAAYVAGFEIIEARGSPISAGQRQTIRETVQGRLMGMEIVEESSDAVIIQYLLDPAKLSAENTLAKLLQNTRAMFRDALQALVTGNRDTAHDVVTRDIEVDRLFLSLSRQFRIVLHEILLEEQTSLDRLRLFDNYTAAAQLERIADHAVKIAQAIEQRSTTSLPATTTELESVGQSALALVAQAMEALTARSTESAHQVLDGGPAIDARLSGISQSLHRLEPETAQLLAIVVDSIGRAKDYGANIAETAINAAALDLGAA